MEPPIREIPPVPGPGRRGRPGDTRSVRSASAPSGARRGHSSRKVGGIILGQRTAPPRPSSKSTSRRRIVLRLGPYGVRVRTPGCLNRTVRHRTYVCEKAIVTLGVLRPPNPVEKCCIPHRFTGTLQKAGRVSAASMVAMPFAYRPYWAFVCAHDALGLLAEPELTELGCRADAAS